MKSIVKLALVATLLMVLLFAAHPSIAQQQESPQPGVFLGNLLRDLKSLGLIKSTSVERKQFNKNEMNTSVTNLARMVRYLLVLKGQGKDNEVNKWVDSLKMSKKFSRSVRMVRKLMRKLAKQQQANGKSPKYVIPIKGVVQSVMKNALKEMKTLLEQSANAAEQGVISTTSPAQQQATPSVNPTLQTWTAVEKMAHKMAKVTNVPAQQESSSDEVNPEEAHLVWEAVEQIARNMAQTASGSSEPAVEPTADLAQG